MKLAEILAIIKKLWRSRGVRTVFHSTLTNTPEEFFKALEEFVQDYLLRYKTIYPDPPKVSMDAVIQHWKLDLKNANLNLAQYDAIKVGWQTKNKVAKILMLFCLRSFFFRIGKLLNRWRRLVKCPLRTSSDENESVLSSDREHHNKELSFQKLRHERIHMVL